MTRLQIGSPIRLTSGRSTFNQNESGVILHNMTASQLQDMMEIRKVNAGGHGEQRPARRGLLPAAVADRQHQRGVRSQRQDAGQSRHERAVHRTGRPAGPDSGQRVFLYGPRQQKWDFSLVKKTDIGERANLEFRMQALNAFNLTNFLLFVPGNGITTTLGANGTGSDRPPAPTGIFRIRTIPAGASSSSASGLNF